MRLTSGSILTGGAALTALALIIAPSLAVAQATTDFGLPPASGSQNPVLPPPSGSQYPVLPPQSGQRYVPGVGGRFGDDAPRRSLPPQPVPRGGELGLAASLSPATKPLDAAQLDRIADLGPALRRCWSPPVFAGPSEGAMATVRFSLRRDGSLFGQPRVTWGTRGGDPDLRARFTRSVVDAVRSCTPLRLSQRLGAAIAGRPFSIRFHGRAPSTERPT